MKSIKKIIYRIFIFIAIILFLSNFQEQPITVRAQTYTTISVQETYYMINNNTLYPDLIVLDVREQWEYNNNHICNSTLIPLAELASRLNELEPYNNTEIIVYCRTGGRSASASQILVNNGFTKVYNMDGGITEWISAGYEVCPEENDQTASPSKISFTFNSFLAIFLGSSLAFIIILKKKL
ncbi:MAG: rhodanese-like domain-containing protein [Candidatus Hermodarchaeota archaeon]